MTFAKPGDLVLALLLLGRGAGSALAGSGVVLAPFGFAIRNVSRIRFQG